MNWKPSPLERETYDHLSDLYSIIVAMEHLERAYTPLCLKLLAQYKTAQSLVTITLQDFIAQYQLSCPAAVKRIEMGVPATVEHPVTSNLSPKNIAEAVQLFITLMDALKLNYVAVDQLHPQLSDLVQSLNRIYHGDRMDRLKEWLITLNKKRASDELDQEQVRQFLFDLENCYTHFQQTLVN